MEAHQVTSEHTGEIKKASFRGGLFTLDAIRRYEATQIE